MPNRLARRLIALPRLAKQLMAASIDAALCLLALSLALVLRLESFDIFQPYFWVLAGLSIALALPALAAFGAYRAIFRYSGEWALRKISLAIGTYGFTFALVVTLLGLTGAPRSVGVVQPMLLLGLVGLSRWAAKSWLSQHLRPKRIAGKALAQVIVYGAGDAGRQLVEAFGRSQELQVRGFVDDASELWGRSINGYPVWPPAELATMARAREVTDVWLALPSLAAARRRQIIDALRPLSLHVRTLPSVADLASGRVAVSDLRELDLDELLVREPVEPRSDLMMRDIQDRVVLVTGAGGSIGSELCRQILRCSPRVLVMLDQSEYALYAIEQELRDWVKALQPNTLGASAPQLVAVLGSVQDDRLLARVFEVHAPSTVFHAAAYKHVPMVECNVEVGMRNNLWGTLLVAQQALNSRVQSFVLVSTDKAVRPTNVMGASKRLAELVVQGLADTPEARACGTRFCMVRFGNVLGSSGSVVPLFREQLKHGGPLTVTHPEVTRYFMTIPEAAQLVVQAGALAKGGEVFVLDMGEPVRIMDLARRVIQLSGRTIREQPGQEGDIAIEIVGLRPGEKLYEELLIGENPIRSSHPKIFQAHEKMLAWPILLKQLSQLDESLRQNDFAHVQACLRILVDGYGSDQTSANAAGFAHGPASGGLRRRGHGSTHYPGLEQLQPRQPEGLAWSTRK